MTERLSPEITGNLAAIPTLCATVVIVVAAIYLLINGVLLRRANRLQSFFTSIPLALEFLLAAGLIRLASNQELLDFVLVAGIATLRHLLVRAISTNRSLLTT